MSCQLQAVSCELKAEAYETTAKDLLL